MKNKEFVKPAVLVLQFRKEFWSFPFFLGVFWMSSLDFVAFDFETANANRASACQIGMAIVKDGVIRETKSWFINPEEEFSYHCMRVHGIHEGVVRHAPKWMEVWPEIRSHFDEVPFLVAHNASFDASVLEALSRKYKYRYKEKEVCCTLKLSRHLWPKLPNHRLPSVIDHIGISDQLMHHEAESDAIACANIFLFAMQSGGMDWVLSRGFPVKGIAIDRLHPNTKETRSAPDVAHASKRGCIVVREKQILNHTFSGKRFCCTGVTVGISRESIRQAVLNRGGHFHCSAVKKLDYLIIPDRGKDFPFPSKKRNVVEGRITNGDPVSIMTESEFLREACLDEDEIQDRV